MKKLIFAALFALFAFAHNSLAVDVEQVKKDLAAQGIEGWIHGSVKDQSLYVFTYRNPKDFFDYLEISLVSDKPETMAKLATFGRHDKVRIKGKILDNTGPQNHVDVASIEMVKKYESAFPTDAYKYDARIPDDLTKANDGDFLVHAVGADGRILVLEHRDAVVPVYVKNAALTKDLVRNDMIHLYYKIAKEPGQPTHLRIDETRQEPVKLVDGVKRLHGKPAKVEGALILFPRSPEIVFNVFAVLQELPSGLKRQFTLVNMENPEAFAKIRAKLQAAWDKYGKDYVNGRNKLISRKVRVRATGTFNEVSANQANTQILLKDENSIEILP